MTYDAFRDAAEAMVEEIPAPFLEGLQGVHVLEKAYPEPGYHDVWRLGEYLDPGPGDFLGGGEGLGRHVALYYGSFVAIAAGDPEFDWEQELWDTLTHELQHHVESLAGDATLIGVDHARMADFDARGLHDEPDDRDGPDGSGGSGGPDGAG